MASEQTVDQAFATVATSVQQLGVDPDVGMDVIKNLNSSGEELRIWVDKANEFGHHATTINILKWIVGYGFTGTIRVFVDPSDAVKLELLLPGYTANMQQLTYMGATIVFQYGGNAPGTAATLLICGGSEASLPELKGRLAKANCSYYLQLQPWHWKSENLLIYGPANAPTVVELTKEITLGKGEFDFCAYTEPAPQRDDTVWDLYGQNQRFTDRVAMAKLLADYAPGAYVVPTYGLATKSVTFSAVLTLILGSIQAIDLMPQSKIPVKPIVILVFDGKLGEPWETLQGYLDGTSDDDDYPEPLKRFVTDQKIAKRFGLCYDDKPKSLQYLLSKLPGNGVLAVSMPGTPSEIFRYFYGSAGLPSVFEGRGTLNLALNLPRPYLCTNSLGYPSPYFTEAAPPGATLAEQTVLAVKQGLFKYNAENPAEFPSSRYAESLCKLLTDQASLQYFADLAATYGQPRFDKLRRALRFCRSIKGFPL